MPDPIIVTASLEGMRVVVEAMRCTLQEYDFKVDTWNVTDEASWPLTHTRAAEWLSGWNDVDRSAALTALRHARYGRASDGRASLKGPEI